MKRIYRDLDNKMIAGICSGISEILNVDPTIVRLVFVFVTVATGFLPCIAVYLVGWLIIPEKSEIIKEEINKEKK